MIAKSHKKCADDVLNCTHRIMVIGIRYLYCTISIVESDDKESDDKNDKEQTGIVTTSIEYIIPIHTNKSVSVNFKSGYILFVDTSIISLI